MHFKHFDIAVESGWIRDNRIHDKEVGRSVAVPSTAPATSSARWIYRMWTGRRSAKLPRARTNTLELPDDDVFYSLRDGEEWTGHWYSRDPIHAPQWQLQ